MKKTPIPEKYKRINEWVKAAQSGDAEARGLLIDSFMPLVIKLAALYGPGEGFEDARQDGILALIEGIYYYDSKEDYRFPGYLRSYLIFYFKKRQEGRFDRSVHPAISLDAPAGSEGTALWELIPDPDNPVLAFVEAEAWKQRMIDLRRALSELSEVQKRAVMAYYYEGKSQRAIAEAENTTEATIKMRIHRGLKQLKKKMGQG
ncbi:MAG: sigma-70 family RNA polymerase sigma factor [Eubacterium sp.]